MQETTALTEQVLIYKDCGRGWESLLAKIRLFVYSYPRRRSSWDDDKCSEFFLEFDSKIPGLVARYSPEYTFETYLLSSLKWFMKTFTEHRCAREIYERWTIQHSTDQFAAGWTDSPDDQTSQSPGSEDSEASPFPLDCQGRFKDPVIRRRVILIALLGAADLESAEIDTIARLVGADSEWLQNKIIEVRECIAAKMERREDLRQRRNECWYKLSSARYRMEMEEARDESKVEEWRHRADVWKNRHAGSTRKLQRLKVAPSHEDIGRILGLPEGTVSCGISLIRRSYLAAQSRESGQGSLNTPRIDREQLRV